jgi:hypothetical protein
LEIQAEFYQCPRQIKKVGRRAASEDKKETTKRLWQECDDEIVVARDRCRDSIAGAKSARESNSKMAWTSTRVELSLFTVRINEGRDSKSREGSESANCGHKTVTKREDEK